MAAYYNEFEPYAAEWLRNLIVAGHIPAGDVDTRSIVDVHPVDLLGYTQCHFFAGIGGWAYAARLAGWTDDRELWTGSAPCQPFSVAGKRRGTDDERHLWPHYFRLVSAIRPAVVMGEQVAAAIGKDWIDGVLADLEGIGYAGRSVVVPACAVNAPHRRDRLWFVADADSEGLEGRLAVPERGSERATRQDGLADAGGARRQQVAGSSHGDESADEGWPAQLHHIVAGNGESQWDSAAWITGHDGKARRVEPSIRLLAHGVPARVGRLRAYGNAIVPQVAAEVIGAYMECAP